MQCRDVDELEAFLKGDLDGRHGTAIHQHVANCSRCQALTTEVAKNLRLADSLRSVFGEELAAQADSHRTPEIIAGYTIVREVGRGGMGIVYEARRQDLQRTVALKVLSASARTDSYRVKLFRREAQALARLRHPCIAVIHDAGCTSDGQHYLVMEFVHGVPLGEYMSLRKLSNRQRLELFRQICRAINYAHQCGVIHLDIKPSNILVDPEGHPKILDFGLARIVDPEATMTTSVTDVGKLQGTLPYMSPEQLRGDPSEVDLRSDVYSLGVILYELLTGRLPYDTDMGMRGGAVQHICQGPPRKPSAINRTLRGDIETIMLKALEKEPSRRYQSTLALAEDIERYWTSQPILARPPSGMYQFRKLVTRHKAPFAVAAMFVLLVMGFGIWMSTLYARAQHAEQLAHHRLTQMVAARDDAVAEATRSQAEARKARKLTTVFGEMLASLDLREVTFHGPTTRKMLDEAAKLAIRELVDYPEIDAEIRMILGNAYLSLGLYGEAEQLLRASLAIRRELFGDEHLKVAESLEHLAAFLLATKSSAAAEPLYWECLAIRRGLLGDNHISVAASLEYVARMRSSAGDTQTADALLDEALEIKRRLLPAGDPEFATFFWNQAGSLLERGDFDGAEEVFRKGLAINEVWIDEWPHRVVGSITNLGWVMRDQGDLQEAERLCNDGLAIAEERFSNSHPSIVALLTLLGLVRCDLGDIEGAEVLLRRRMDVIQEIAGADTPLMADTLGSLAGVLWAKGDYPAAERLFREVIRLGGQYGDEPRSIHDCWINSLAVVLRDAGKYDEAEQVFQRALTDSRHVHGSQNRWFANTLNNYARLLYLTRDHLQAEMHIREALRIRQAALPETHLDVAESKMVLGMILTATDDLSAAEPLLREALEIRSAQLPEGNWLIAEADSALAGCLTKLKRYDEAEHRLLASMATLEDKLDPRHKLIRQTRERLAVLYEAVGSCGS